MHPQYLSIEEKVGRYALGGFLTMMGIIILGVTIYWPFAITDTSQTESYIGQMVPTMGLLFIFGGTLVVIGVMLIRETRRHLTRKESR